MIFVVTETEGAVLATFYDAAEAVEFCDSPEQNQAMFINCYVAKPGPVEPAPGFWKSHIDYATGEVWTERTDIYKYGSDTQPCRDGATFAGRVVRQELSYGVAWGATLEQAESRVKAWAVEGRRRAARDAAYRAVTDAVLEERRAKDGDSNFWDPHGFWIDAETERKAIAAGDAAVAALG